MNSGWDLKGRDFTHVETGNRATVIDVRVDAWGRPLMVLVRSYPDEIVEWVKHADFDGTHAKVPIEQVRKNRRGAQMNADYDTMDQTWNDLLNQI